jgi:cyclopropane-fatty-acyl-phospholipid synthase
MSLIENAARMIERLPMPDSATLLGVNYLVRRSSRRLSEIGADDARAFAQAMSKRPIAEHIAEAKAQHYELPPEFFGLFLGARRKYSSALYGPGIETLDQAEEYALAETAAHAGLADGQDILELGCGWGSLSLWMAEQYPHARITSVSNSRPQRTYIEAEAMRRGLANLSVVTAEIGDFAPERRFDRVVSVEMFEHLANWQALLARIRTWLAPGGLLFLHVFSHRSLAYRFDPADKSDWIAQHFFTGGIMPSHSLIGLIDAGFEVTDDWRWSGKHYERTALDWLANYDRKREEIEPVLKSVYGTEAALWRRRWRLFFLATAGLFGSSRGEEYGVSHYRLRPVT